MFDLIVFLVSSTVVIGMRVALSNAWHNIGYIFVIDLFLYFYYINFHLYSLAFAGI